MPFIIALTLAMGAVGAAIVLKRHLDDVSERREALDMDLVQMSKYHAEKILALAAPYSMEDVKERYRQLLHKLHPDQGGSAYLTQWVVKAKETLERGSGHE